ncbi:MAG TPA: DUF167 domain-containing protein [Elusimicrobiota bacterium]|nr:DUF167 domain-containing protein [Elusimicrobiota bacterium]
MLLKLRVHPGSKKAAVSRKGLDAYEIWVRAEAREGLANAEALAILARDIGVGREKLRLVKGSRTPSKIVQVFK